MTQIWVKQPLFWLGTALRALAIVLVLSFGGPWRLPGLALAGELPAGPLATSLLLPARWMDGTAALAFTALMLIGADLAMLEGLRRLFALKPGRLLRLYWLSPAVLLIAYPQFAFADMLGAALLCWALAMLKKDRPREAGALAALSAGACVIGLMAIPLLLIFYFRNPTWRAQLLHALASLGVTAVILLLGQGLLTRIGLQAGFSSDWVEQILGLNIPLRNPERSIAVAPVVYVLCMFAVWRMRRIGTEILAILCGLMYLVLSMTTGLSAAWLLWALPMLVFVSAESGAVSIGLINLMAALYVATGAVAGSNLLPPLALASCLVISSSIWRYNIQDNDLRRISRKPLVIGIAGDSGAGKDTLVDSIAALFEQRSVVRLSGDDYHFWDRHKPMWQVMTHLNPRANDLGQFARDLIALAGGKGIVAPHYDHVSGRKSRPIQTRSSDVIVASGLHALYLPMLREAYDLSIYLDIDEGLRRFLKMDRDVRVRGHSAEKVMGALEVRETDASRFIRPQREHAQLVLSLCPVRPQMLTSAQEPSEVRFKLVVHANQGFHEEILVRTLVAICGLHVDMALGSGDNAVVEMSIEGDMHAQDMALAAKTLVPQLLPLLKRPPQWHDGVQGLMQLIVLAHLNEAVRSRLL